jgi:hypothetical protein
LRWLSPDERAADCESRFAVDKFGVSIVSANRSRAVWISDRDGIEVRTADR